MYCIIKILDENGKLIEEFHAGNRQQYADLIDQLQFTIPPDHEAKFIFDVSAEYG